MGLKNHAILLIHCNDRKGLISTITHFLFEHNGNIIDLDEHVDKTDGIFFMRVEWELDAFDIPKEEIRDAFANQIANEYEMQWQLHFTDRKPRMAVFVSKASHCLYDILSRHYSGEWQVEIPAIISNHKMHEELAQRYGIPFYFFEMNKENKAEIERAQMTLLTELGIDFMILARYMQILSDEFIQSYPNKIINIHHSFLPAFAGAKPYHRAYERGVKIIGATSHYVTADLDAGPILEQDVAKITHKDTVEDLIRKGKDLEKIVLSRAIWTHLERKALVHNNKTVIFD
ncbi:MAG: formyltetrahydrofolate deformylase [Flammeovirgaceae bacterium]|nr:formyltetrahydrofolate deformylase [Flammeovirgaceae bacterium]MBE63425.1 formyltetrahydrofolate deformylase [Flammeovirgaceae bacterium]MBR08329.1 formyltetrahydrofolate deformylase [Rickettsiales bacterium]HCX24698.1 formyltetrahydrofolate deformylase [Cytophagales bacterium]|tara:strand:+ start:2656 stop:3519 length:864 start_codon:yes stop_codon:yes gene_type:complete